MRTAKIIAVVAAAGAALTGAPTASAAITVTGHRGGIVVGDSACLNLQHGLTCDDEPSPGADVPSGTAPFSFNEGFDPPQAAVSDPAHGSVSADSQGHMNATLAVASRSLRITFGASGLASAQITGVHSPDFRDAEGHMDASLQVTFTTDAPVPYDLSGAGSAGSSSVELSGGGLDIVSPQRGTLEPGTYTFQADAGAREHLPTDPAVYADETRSTSPAGSFSLTVGGSDPTATSVLCPGPVHLGIAATCQVDVDDVCAAPCTKTAPSGDVAITFAGGTADSGCTLVPSPVTGRSSCAVRVNATAYGSHQVTADYAGDGRHAASTGRATVATSDHYVVELRAWIPKAHVVDPYQPTPAPLFQVADPLFQLLQPGCEKQGVVGGLTSTVVSSTFRGDAHATFDGTFRVHVIASFDWDGRQVANLTVSPDATNYGATHLDFRFTRLSDGSLIGTCATEATATKATFGAPAFGGNGFLLRFESSNPLVTPQFAVPAIDSQVLGSFDAEGDLHLAFKTDLFPSHGIAVTRDGIRQGTATVNDASCLADDTVLGLTGMAVLSYGLSSIQQNMGSFVIPHGARGGSAARSSPLCSQSYDDLQIFSRLFGSASTAAASGITVAPAGGGAAMPLGRALRRGLVAGVQRAGVTSLLVEPAHPVRIVVRDRHAIVQESGVRGGRARRGAQFGPVSGKLALTVGNKVTARANGHRLHARPPDHKPPVTRAKVRLHGRRATVRLHARDASGVARTVLIAGGRTVRLRHGTAHIKRSKLGGARFYSVDALGNRERARRLPARR